MGLTELGDVVRARPRDPLALYRWAVALARAGQRPTALDAVRQALPLATRAPLAVGIGKLFEILEQPVEALAAYRRSTQLDPSHLEGQICMANLLTRVGDPRAAALAMQAALARSPEVPGLELELAEALLASGAHGEALDHARRAAALGAAPATVEKLTARIQEAQSRAGSATPASGGPPSLKLEEATAMVNRARQLISAGDNASALALLDHLVRSGPSDPALKVALGVTLVHAGSRPAGIAVLRQAVQQAPDNAAIHLALGRMLRAGGQLDEATATLRTAVRLAPYDAPTLFELGTLLGQIGQLEDSAHLLVRAASLAPADEEIREALARALASAPKRPPPPAPSNAQGPTPGPVAAAHLPPQERAPPPPAMTPAPRPRPPTGSGIPLPRQQTQAASRRAPGGITSDLSMFSLPELLEFLLQQRATGTLSLRSDSQEGALDLLEGQLIAARHPGGKRLAEILLEDRHVPMSELMRAVPGDFAAEPDASLAATVVRAGLLPKEKVHELVASQIKAALLVLVPWREGQAVFHRAAKGAPPPVAELVIETRWALMETVRLLDEERRDSSPAPAASPSFDPFEGL